MIYNHKLIFIFPIIQTMNKYPKISKLFIEHTSLKEKAHTFLLRISFWTKKQFLSGISSNVVMRKNVRTVCYFTINLTPIKKTPAITRKGTKGSRCMGNNGVVTRNVKERSPLILSVSLLLVPF